MSEYKDVFVRPGMIAGTTDLGPLAVMIKSMKPGPLRMFDQDVASHTLETAIWYTRYRDILDANEKAYKCKIATPNVPDGTLVGIEATFPRARWRRLDDYLLRRSARKHYVYVADPGNPRLRSDNEINQFLWAFVGKKYELSVFLRNYGAQNFDPNDNETYCSEQGHRLMDFLGTPHPESWQYGLPPVDQQLEFTAMKRVVWKCYPKDWM